MKKRLNRDEGLSFSQFVEELLWESMKQRADRAEKPIRTSFRPTHIA